MKEEQTKRGAMKKRWLKTRERMRRDLAELEEVSDCSTHVERLPRIFLFSFHDHAYRGTKIQFPLSTSL